MNIKSWIKSVLVKCHYVKWDRYVIFDDDKKNDYMLIYGWINRDKDDYKDFALIEFGLTTKSINLVLTSSAKWSAQFNKDTGGLEIDHNHCQRAEDDFKIDNTVRLKTTNKNKWRTGSPTKSGEYELVGITKDKKTICEINKYSTDDGWQIGNNWDVVAWREIE